MLGTYITFPELLLWIPLLAGFICFFIRNEKAVKSFSLFAAIITLGVSIWSLGYTDESFKAYNYLNRSWLPQIGNSFYIGLDGTGRLLTLLTAIAFPAIFIATYKNKYKNVNIFYGLMMLTQGGLMGVFTAMDALLFYFFWELALIPVYFLCSRWGGEKRIQATFKFFIYTFLGSLLMLAGIIYIYLHTPGRTFVDGLQVSHSFLLRDFYAATLSASEQGWLFWLFFVAFAVKMPVFPFHTWQPDTYDQAPAPVTMILSGIMVKMGLFGVIRWLMPVLPEGVEKYTNIVMILSITGIIYASCIALVQDNLRKLVAYSSIAHIGLMCAAIFAMNEISLQGVMLQMFSHGINIIALWMVVEKIELKTGVKSISALGGIANKAPALTILFVIIALANIALPLTNAFVGELLMFTGLFGYNSWYAAIAGVSIILAAVYTLNMIRKVFYGNSNTLTEGISDISFTDKIVLSTLVLIIFITGIYPQPLIDLTREAVNTLLVKVK